MFASALATCVAGKVRPSDVWSLAPEALAVAVPTKSLPELSMRSLSVVPAPMMTVSARPAVPAMLPIMVLLEPVVSENPEL